MPGPGLASAEAIRSALAAADFPATKDGLIEIASDAGADDRVLGALRSLPVEEYANREEVIRSVETIEATGSTPSQHAGQARQDGRPGLAQHQRTIG
jgi:hypothetical protein